MICVGTDLEMSKKAIELAEKYEGPPSPRQRRGYGRASIWATVGCHPNELIKELQIADVKSRGDHVPFRDYEELAKHPKVVAIGETGLDYYRTPEKEKQEKQKEFFQQFLELAVGTKKPAVIHCRNAYDDLISLLNAKRYPLNAVIHSFTGSFELARKFLDLDLYLGLNGIITFPPSHKAMEGQTPTDLEETVTNIPLNRILIETDAPYLAPVPHRGKRNEPLYVEFVARRIAEIKKVSFEEVVEKTRENTKKLFKLG